MTKETIMEELTNLISIGRNILTTGHETKYTGTCVDAIQFNSWKTKVIVFLNSFLKEQTEIKDVFIKANRADYATAEICVRTLEDVKEYVEKDFFDREKDSEIDTEVILERIFMRFYKIARQLRNRHDNRQTLSIEDEYDVQDLLHALLHLYFDDIRPEEWTPSYAGKSARVDFLLKNEKTVIEVKKTRHGLADKEVGDQLIIDVDRYKGHPDCEKLICFVYDPEGRIGNPNGIMDDLNTRHQGFVTVVIQPNM